MNAIHEALTLRRGDRDALVVARAERRAALEAHYREERIVLLSRYQREMRPTDYRQAAGL